MKDILDYKAVGSRVRERRLKLDLTQEQLAEKADILPTFVGHIERGEKKASLETMSRLVMVLGTTMDYLVLGINCRCDQQTCELYNDLQELLDSYGKGMHQGECPDEQGKQKGSGELLRSIWKAGSGDEPNNGKARRGETRKGGERFVDKEVFLSLVDKVVVGEGLRFVLRDGTEWEARGR